MVLNIKSNNERRRNTILSYIIILFSSLSNEVVMSAISLFIMSIIISIYYFFINKSPKSFFAIIKPIIVIGFIYFFGVYFSINNFPYITSIVRFASYLYLGIIITDMLKDKFVYYIENAIYVLVNISLMFFTIQILNYNLLYNVIEGITKFLSYSSHSTTQSIFIYTIGKQPSSFTELRNYGFAYEPGYFSMFPIIGLLFYFLENKNRKKKTMHIFIYIMALISTQSTTGFVAFCILLLFYGFTKKNVIKLVVTIPLILLIISLPLVKNKIEEGFTNRGTTDDILQSDKYFQSQEAGKKVSMGRFLGLEYQLGKVYRDSPFFGFFGNENEALLTDTVQSASGIGNFIQSFGFVGLVLLILSLSKSSIVIMERYYPNKKYSYIVTVFIILYLFAFTFTNSLLLWCLIQYGYNNNKYTLPKNIILPKSRPARY